MNIDRRRVLIGAAAVPALPLLAACGSSASGVTAKPGTVLAKTADVKVGGAVFLDGVVITQPTAGDFHAFDRTCTHQACPVTDLQGGDIHCSCHGSLYDTTTGDVVQGPATEPLAKIDITVDGTEIVKA